MEAALLQLAEVNHHVATLVTLQALLLIGNTLLVIGGLWLLSRQIARSTAQLAELLQQRSGP